MPDEPARPAPPLGPRVQLSEEEKARARLTWRRLSTPYWRALLDAPPWPEKPLPGEPFSGR